MSLYRSTSGWRESLAIMRPRPVDRRTNPHLRCGLCDEPIAHGDATEYVDDERCHERCARVDRGDSDD